MQLTQDNYYSLEANNAYMSASFVKSMLNCQAMAIAELSGEYERPKGQALMVGSYVDSYFEGTIDLFRNNNPEILKRDGCLKSECIKAGQMIARAESDPVFMEFMEGEKQRIFAGEIFGIPFKAKLDVYLPGKRIVDLKTTKDMEPMYKPGQGRVSFADYWNWPLQMAIYQQLEGNQLPCYLAVITKESPPNIEVIQIPQHLLDTEMQILKDKLPYFDAVKQGLIGPERCERCEYCRKTKKLSGAISLDSITEM